MSLPHAWPDCPVVLQTPGPVFTPDNLCSRSFAWHAALQESSHELPAFSILPTTKHSLKYRATIKPFISAGTIWNHRWCKTVFWCTESTALIIKNFKYSVRNHADIPQGCRVIRKHSVVGLLGSKLYHSGLKSLCKCLKFVQPTHTQSTVM